VAVTPLTAAVLAAVGDADQGEASGVNDASARIGGVIVIALVPALIGATGGRSYAHALVGGYRPAMIVMAALCVAAALVTAVFVSDSRARARRVVPRAPDAGCAVPVPAAAPGPVPRPLTQEAMS
jgi:nitrate/nitrite transporter NarK